MTKIDPEIPVVIKNLTNESLEWILEDTYFLKKYNNMELSIRDIIDAETWKRIKDINGEGDKIARIVHDID